MPEDFPLEHVSVAPNEPNEPSPAVFLLHGRGTNERDLLPLAEELPDDLHTIGIRAPASLGPGFTWYELDLSGGGLHASQPDADDFRESLVLVHRTIDLAVDQYDLDPDNIGLLGFSQGAILSLGSMIEHPSAYAWIVALHGYLPAMYEQEEIEDVNDTPVFIGAGARDEIIPSTRAEDAAERLSAGGVDVTFRTYPIGHGTSPEELTDVKEWLAAKTELV